MSADYVETAKKNRKDNKGAGHIIRPIPLQYYRLQAGDNIQIGKHQWQVYIGRGHSPEHVCLFNADTNVLISGDHVLPGISPNIGVYSTEPDANSLKNVLRYSATIYPRLPEDTLVLPLA